MPGLMWFSQFPHDGQLSIRHTCEQNDHLPKYGWLKHDGTRFGVQEIVDNDFILSTEFVKRPGGDHGGDWTVRISGKSREQVKCCCSRVVISPLAAVTPVSHYANTMIITA